jgi:hypothetical protein
MRRFWWFLVCAAFVCVALFFSRPDRGFAIGRIASDLPISTEWPSDISEKQYKELTKAFREPLRALGSGAQCYAFSSACDQYVLKFFKMKHLLPKKWLPVLPLAKWREYRTKKVQQKEKNRKELFNSYKIAYDHFRDESALVAIHLSKTTNWHLPVTLIDKRGRAHHLNLDDFEFVVQRKAERLGDYLSGLLQEKKRDEVLETIRSLLEQIVLQCQKGFFDTDSGIFANYGVIEGKVVHFDSGRLKAEPEAASHSFCEGMLERAKERIAIWLQKREPELLREMEGLVLFEEVDL